MHGKKKAEIITFKVDESLSGAMEGIPNRSEFIRFAVLAALHNTCPLCKGEGILTPDQQRHWLAFSKDHHLRKCSSCHAYHLVCSAGPGA